MGCFELDILNLTNGFLKNLTFILVLTTLSIKGQKSTLFYCDNQIETCFRLTRQCHFLLLDFCSKLKHVQVFYLMDGQL